MATVVVVCGCMIVVTGGSGVYGVCIYYARYCQCVCMVHALIMRVSVSVHYPCEYECVSVWVYALCV